MVIVPGESFSSSSCSSLGGQDGLYCGCYPDVVAIASPLHRVVDRRWVLQKGSAALKRAQYKGQIRWDPVGVHSSNSTRLSMLSVTAASRVPNPSSYQEVHPSDAYTSRTGPEQRGGFDNVSHHSDRARHLHAIAWPILLTELPPARIRPRHALVIESSVDSVSYFYDTLAPFPSWRQGQYVQISEDEAGTVSSKPHATPVLWLPAVEATNKGPFPGSGRPLYHEDSDGIRCIRKWTPRHVVPLFNTSLQKAPRT
ncbi:hypothetical protein FNAPI_6235 [Fusarium napiforme]|uniref:Uncharacterized protein n=1 Tax=Fusarium napiforme TaxID=42672 RepID=A0A8H5JL34_9HYPO|nr:hypothetical protein FNAPI_6235 [Fusarium napiforme]